MELPTYAKLLLALALAIMIGSLIAAANWITVAGNFHRAAAQDSAVGALVTAGRWLLLGLSTLTITATGLLWRLFTRRTPYEKELDNFNRRIR